MPPLSSAVCDVHSAHDTASSTITEIIVGTKSSKVDEVAKDSGFVTLLAEGHHGAEA